MNENSDKSNAMSTKDYSNKIAEASMRSHSAKAEAHLWEAKEAAEYSINDSLLNLTGALSCICDTLASNSDHGVDYDADLVRNFRQAIGVAIAHADQQFTGVAGRGDVFAAITTVNAISAGLELLLRSIESTNNESGEASSSV